MKKLIKLMCLTAITWLHSSSLTAQDLTNYHDLTCHDFNDQNFEVSMQHDQIKKARFKDHHHEHLKFRQSRALATYMHHLDSNNDLNYAIGFSSTKFKHAINKKFDNLLLGLGWAHQGIDKWLLKANVAVAMDADHRNLSRYSFFTGTLRGRYTLNDKTGLHLGIIGCTGLRYTRILPILGVDYAYSEEWLFKAILPGTFAAIYNVNPSWSVELATRYFLTRQRLSSHRYPSHGLIAYRNGGLELGVNYRTMGHIIANVHIGHTATGRLRIGNSHDRHRHSYKIKPSSYWGAELVASF